MSKEAIIIGYSGHAYVLLDVLLANKFMQITYCEQQEKSFNPYHIKYLGNEKEIDVLKLLQDKPVFIGIGSNQKRAEVFEQLVKNKVNMPFIIHPSATKSSFINIGNASVVMQGAIINSLCKIGNAVICNSGCIIEHECVINDYVHIAPGAVLAGNVIVGEHTFIGANVVVKQGVKIGKRVVIGAGSVVVKDIADDCIAYGNPAKRRS